MLPGIEDWLSASFSDYKRRFWPLMSVLAAGGLITALVVFLPLIPAAMATFFGWGSPWLIWSGALLVALVAGLWLSTWSQAAAVIASATDEGAADAMREGWRRTPAFAWSLTLVMLAAGGGFVFLIVPGLVLTVLLFFAPFYQLGGEAEGLDSLELSWARVRPHAGAVAGRLILLVAVVWAPSWIPYVGWLIGPLWAPFGLVACARLAADLRAAAPEPARPSLRTAVTALSAVLLVSMFAASFASALAVERLRENYASGKLNLPAPDGATAQSLLALFHGQGSDADVQRSLTYVISLSSAVGKAP